MKKALNPRKTVSKKLKCSSIDACHCRPCSRQEKEEAMTIFAQVKAAKTDASDAEMQELRLLLRRRSLLKQFDAHLAPVMPEIYCLLTQLFSTPLKLNSPSAKLAFLIVSTWLMASRRDRI